MVGVGRVLRRRIRFGVGRNPSSLAERNGQHQKEANQHFWLFVHSRISNYHKEQKKSLRLLWLIPLEQLICILVAAVAPQTRNGLWLLLICQSEDILPVSVKQVVVQMVARFSFQKIIHLEGILILLEWSELEFMCVDGQIGSLPCLYPTINIFTPLLITPSLLLIIFLLIVIRVLILLPDVFDLIQRTLEPKSRRIDINPARYSSNSPFKVYQFLHQQGHIQLFFYFLLALCKYSHFAPVLATDESIEDPMKQIPQIVDEIELICADLFLIIIAVQSAAEAELIAKFIIRVKDEDKSENGADQSSDIGQQSVQLLVGPSVAGVCA